MRIYLVSPTHYDANGALHKTTRYWTSALTLPYLKAITPPGHDVQFVDELMHDVDLDHDCDVVGITAMGPQIARAYDLAPDIAALRAKGIQVIALIMVGLDGDTPDTFGRTLQFLLDSKVSFLKLFTPCPYPGTKYYDDLAKQGRILDGNWARYDYGSPIIKPTGMTSDQMMDGFKYVYEGFYSIPNILKRCSPPPKGQLLESLAYVVANLKVNRYLRSNERAWATIS